MGRRQKRTRRRQRQPRQERADYDLKDLFDLDDFFKQRSDFDWDEWRKLRRRVIVDASSKRDTGFPIGLGLAALVVGLMFGLGPLLPIAGVLILFAGLAVLTSRLFRGFRKLATKAFRRFFESKKARQKRTLEDLDHRLRNDGEPRTEHLLRSLLRLYESLEEDIQDGTLTIVAKDVLESVDRVNRVCIENLDESHQLWEEAQADPYSRQIKLEQREALIQDVAQSVEHLKGVVAQLHQQSLNRNRNELKRLRAELDETLEVAKRVEARTEDLVSSSEVYEIEEGG